MRLHVVSDVHGNAQALSKAADGADGLICLGDLVLFIDYDDYSAGIFPDLFGAENTRRFVELRTADRFAEAREWSNALWAELGGDRHDHVERMVRDQYAEIFAAMPVPTWLTYGNVDIPAFWPDYLRAGHHLVDGAAVEIGGLRFGFVGGGLISPMRTPFELSEEQFAAKVDALGDIDVLCSHIPPAVPELTYDVVARRFEKGSTALLRLIETVQPRWAVFGHVHQPLAARRRIGRTECINVGHFRANGSPVSLEW